MLAVSKAADDSDVTPFWLTKRGREGMANFLRPFGTYAPGPEYGQRLKMAPAISITTSLAGTIARGLEPTYSRDMRAEWSRASAPVFSPSCSDAFRAAIQSHYQEATS